MTDSNDDQNDSSGNRKPLSLSRSSGASTVRQSFSHGRSKQVLVEKKKRRISTKPLAKPTVGPQKPSPENTSADAEKLINKAKAKALGLSEQELKARQMALSKRQSDELARQEKARQVAEQHRQRELEERKKLEEAKALEEANITKRKAEEKAATPVKQEKTLKHTKSAKTEPAPVLDPDGMPPPPAADASKRRSKAQFDDPTDADMLEELGGRVKKGRAAPVQKTPNRGRGEPKRRQGKLTITAALEGEEERQRSLASVRRARERERERRSQMSEDALRDRVRREVVVPESITVQELANRMSERVGALIKYMMQQGEVVRGNDVIDADTAELLIAEFGHTIRRVSDSDVEIGLEGPDDDPATLKPRPPVVTVMGHVDHGKTSLLDALRETDVVSGESGGITQHIGAYQVSLPSGEKITFLDTPGHAAFSSMRARGANITDIVILVVAADDGVMPQTIEAISHAKAASVPIIVAINKMDVQGADPNKVLTELLQHEVVVETMGGEVQAIEVSALKKTGLDALTEAITLQAELLELKANTDRVADGVVIESKLDRGRGSVATVLINRGELKRGDIVVAGTQWGKVRALMNERNQMLKSAGPTLPVEILGLDGAPNPGEPFVVVENEARAREITAYRDRRQRQGAGSAPSNRVSLEQALAKLKQEGAEHGGELPLVLKGDVQGSVEAITQSVEKLSNDEVRARVVHGAVGAISESDILLARSSGAPVIAFNVRANKQALDMAEKEGVEIRYYSIIYDLINEVKDILSGMLESEKRENFIGYADILKIFNISKLGKVAGCLVTEGAVKRGCGVRLLRDNIVIHEGKLSTLKRFKDEVPEVNAGTECGMAFENYHDLHEGDRIECFEIEEIKRTLD